MDLPVLVWAARPLHSDDRPDADLDAAKANVVALLVLAGADIEARSVDEGDQTTLHLAARFGFPMTTSALLEAGANAEARDTEGNTPLTAAASNPAVPLETIEVLLAAGANPTATLNDGTPALDLAHETGRQDGRDLLEAAQAP